MEEISFLITVKIGKIKPSIVKAAPHWDPLKRVNFYIYLFIFKTDSLLVGYKTNGTNEKGSVPGAFAYKPLFFIPRDMVLNAKDKKVWSIVSLLKTLCSVAWY